MGAFIAALVTIIDVAGKILNGIKAGKDAFAVVTGVVWHSKELRAVFEKLNPDVANFLGGHISRFTETVARGHDGIFNELVQHTMTGHDTVADAAEISSLKRAAGEVAARPALVQANIAGHSGIMGAGAQKAEALLGTLVNDLMSLYTDKLQARKDDLPEKVNEVASEMVSRALEFGLSAQLAAVAVELLYPTKYTGLNQLVGYLANFAGFDEITKPIINPQLKWALSIPAEHQAAKLFRTRIPGAEDVRDQAVQRHVTAADYRRALQLEGFPEDWIDVKVADMFIDPRPREIMQLVDGADVDPAWLVSKYREVGWDDDDVRKAVNATIKRNKLPAAQRYLGTFSNSYLAGFVLPGVTPSSAAAAEPIPQGWAASTYHGMRAAVANVSDDDGYSRLYLAALQEERRHKSAEQLAAAVIDQFQNDIIGPDATENMLEALGYDAGEVTRRRALAELRRNTRLIKQETADVEALAKSLRTSALTAIKGELRAGTMTRDEFTTFAGMIGYQASFAGAIADLELLKLTPRTVPETATAGLAHLRTSLNTPQPVLVDGTTAPLPGAKELTAAALANLKAQLAAGTLTRDEFLSLGRMLGYGALELEQLADVQQLRMELPLQVIAASDAATLAAHAQAALTDLAANLVTRRIVNGAAAVTLLQNAGVPLSAAAVAIAIAEIAGLTIVEYGLFPFQDLSNNKLVWSSVLDAVKTVAQGDFKSGKLVTDLLAIVGGNAHTENELKGILTRLTGLFGGRPGRTRQPATTTRPPSPTDLVPGPGTVEGTTRTNTAGGANPTTPQGPSNPFGPTQPSGPELRADDGTAALLLEIAQLMTLLSVNAEARLGAGLAPLPDLDVFAIADALTVEQLTAQRDLLAQRLAASAAELAETPPLPPPTPTTPQIGNTGGSPPGGAQNPDTTL